MQWFKTWLRKWLGLEDEVELIRRRQVDGLMGEFVKVGVRLDNLMAEVKHLSDSVGCNAQVLTKHHDRLSVLDINCLGIQGACDINRTGLLDVVRLGECDTQRISELETLVKDATIDTALAELEDRVAKLESTPPPTPTPTQNGRRGGSAWGPHQAAAAAGALLDKGTPNPIPTPGVS